MPRKEILLQRLDEIGKTLEKKEGAIALLGLDSRRHVRMGRAAC